MKALLLLLAVSASASGGAKAPVSPIKSVPAMIVAPLVSVYQYVFVRAPAVPFTPTPGQGHYYHGTSWADLMAAAQNGGALSPDVTYLARAPHHSEPYADSRAKKQKSKAIVLEFEEKPVDALSAFSGRPAGLYPAYRAHSAVPLSHLTQPSKQAILDEFDRQGGSPELRAALVRVLGLSESVP